MSNGLPSWEMTTVVMVPRCLVLIYLNSTCCDFFCYTTWLHPKLWSVFMWLLAQPKTPSCSAQDFFLFLLAVSHVAARVPLSRCCSYMCVQCFSTECVTVDCFHNLMWCRQYQSVNLPMWKTSSIQGAPRLCFVATVTSQPVVAPYLFCNYRHRPLAKEVREEGLGSGGSSGRSHYQQRCDTQCWEAIMASTAAPGFFEEVRLAQDMFMVRSWSCCWVILQCHSVPVQS